ncbi:MAG: class I SAM-dependent methyltransferase [Spartobacteria bacterium]
MSNVPGILRFRGALLGGALQDPVEISAAIDYIRAEKPRCICEIGTANGGTNLLLTHLLETVEIIFGVDLYITNGTLLQLLLRPGQTLHLVNGSSYSPETVDRVEASLAGRKIDMLFIDGDHRYDGVKQDFLFYSPLVREDGLIMFHDIVPDHFARYGRPGPRSAGDVPRFWSALKPHYRHQEFIHDPDQDGLGLGILHWSRETPLPVL